MVDRAKFIRESLEESAATKKAILNKCFEEISRAVTVVRDALGKDNKVLLCGNGGSAADAQHIATEFTIRLSHDIKRRGLPVMALTTDPSAMTAGGNDIGFENTFARLVEAFGRKGDVLIGISTSGNSENVIRAVDKAHENGMFVIGFLGKDGGKLKSRCDLPIIVPSENTQRIQEGHITIGHIISELAELELYAQNKN
ncbi:MAG: SIS domain-containing protein [Bacteroidetes bacterium]|jgi:D-sedoheptulose 7-phosphate isomerase|nr:SIS domain-containing protein [Bacteroidota bacterium]MCL5034369.1 SIS domain-containing protein [Bacteroidota bacterium]